MSWMIWLYTRGEEGDRFGKEDAQLVRSSGRVGSLHVEISRATSTSRQEAPMVLLVKLKLINAKLSSL